VRARVHEAARNTVCAPIGCGYSRNMRFRSIAPIAVIVLASCTGARDEASHAGAEAKNAVSPIVGAWTINGDIPPPKANLPQFVRLDFQANGKLDASYVAAGGALAGVVNTTPKTKSERDSYTLDGSDHLSLIEGSRALDFTYAVRDRKLFLTRNDGSVATVYQRASETQNRGD